MYLPRISTLNTSWQSFSIAAQAAGGEGGRASLGGGDTAVPTVPTASTAAHGGEGGGGRLSPQLRRAGGQEAAAPQHGWE